MNPDKLAEPRVSLEPVAGGTASWSDGFFAGLFARSAGASRETLRMALWHPENSATFENFKTAALLKDERARTGFKKKYEFAGGTGDWIPTRTETKARHQGTSWSDGDCYKYMEGLCRLYSALDPDKSRDEIKKELDELVDLVAAAQENDGYLNTQIQIPYKARWITRIHHEDYNLGHLFTAAAVHHAATGESEFLDVARKAADNAYEHFMIRQRDAAYFGWNPTHIPGLVDLYRATGDRRYLDLALVFLDRRGAEHTLPVQGGDPQGPDDENQMAVPFRDENEAVGHAVTAGYLYLGASEIYRETGDAGLLEAAERIWRDVVDRKLYITGAIGALPVGISKRGFKIWEAFGREYQLPHRTAYNETCANIAWGMFCRSMFMATGQARYADEMERLIYNAGISGVSASGDSFNYANPLRWYTQWDTGNESFGTMRHFSHDRWKIHTCYCCPPQEFRFTVQLADWVYYTAPGTVYVALYGSGAAVVEVPGAGTLRLRQETNYPWDGSVRIVVEEAPEGEVSIALRIPGWCDQATVTLGGGAVETHNTGGAIRDASADNNGPESGKFCTITRVWTTGDEIGLVMPMPVRLVTAHPKIEECRGQAAVMRGPLVYCAESVDLPEGVELEDVALCRDFDGTYLFEADMLGGITTVTGRGRVAQSPDTTLYRDLNRGTSKDINLKLIPYFAWRNRGRTDMTVWMTVV